MVGDFIWPSLDGARQLDTMCRGEARATITPAIFLLSLVVVSVQCDGCSVLLRLLLKLKQVKGSDRRARKG